MRKLISSLFILTALNASSQNTSQGSGALANVTTGDYNAAFGAMALNGISTGSYNTGIGFYSLRQASNSLNVALGSYSGYNVTTGENNIFIGHNGGRDISTGSGNVIIGSNFAYNTFSSSLSNTIVLADGNGTQRFYINSSGDAGIGTTSPAARLDIQGGKVRIGNVSVSTTNDYKLYVETGILTEKVKVAVKTGDWSDYVFEKNYKLRPLTDVEKFINKNKHLPGIPSATEVEKNGLDLGAMDAKLLEKIEELTLYIINQQKEIEKLNKKVEDLSAKK